jgi:hypothetical protein
MKEILVGKIDGLFHLVSPDLLIGVWSDYCQRALVGDS